MLNSASDGNERLGCVIGKRMENAISRLGNTE